MAIIQSSNKPIVIELDTDISSATDVSVALVYGSTVVKHWSKSDMTITGKVISITVTQEETSTWVAGNYRFKIKCLLDNYTEFFDAITCEVKAWEDQTILSLT